MMKKKYINVSDVKQIEVVAPGASGVTATMIWNNVSTKNSIRFEAEYKYDGLEEGWKYCPYCGNVFKPTVHPTIDKCGCDEEVEVMTSLEEINKYIWDSLEDKEPMTVNIHHIDGHIDHFSL